MLTVTRDRKKEREKNDRKEDRKRKTRIIKNDGGKGIYIQAKKAIEQ